VQQLDVEREHIVRSDCLVLDVENNALTLPSYLLPNLPKERELYAESLLLYARAHLCGY
jgi:hypothetical protein